MFVGTCWNRSQLVLTANFRSFSLIGLQIGSPSRFTSTAGVLLKKIAGGSAFMPSMFFGMIWLLSTLARTRSRAITRSSSGIAFSIAAAISANLIFLQRLEIGFGDLEVLKLDESIRHRHDRVGFEPDRAKCRLFGSDGAEGRRAERHHLLLRLPARDLRLIHEDVAAAGEV